MKPSTPLSRSADAASTPANKAMHTNAGSIGRFALIPILALAIAGATLGGIAFADDHMGGATDRPDVLRLYSLANLDADAEVYVRANGEPPPTTPDDVAAAGDVTILEDQLFALRPHTNERTGDQLGVTNGQCTFVAVDEPSFTALRADALCSAVVTLPRGTITLDGLVTVDFAKAARDIFAITGGTGAYAGVEGTAIVTGLPPEGDSESAIVEFRFSR